MANLGDVAKSATLNCIHVLAQWQDILKGPRQRRDLEFLYLVKLPRKIWLPTALPILLWSCLPLTSGPAIMNTTTPWKTASLSLWMQRTKLVIRQYIWGVPINGHNSRVWRGCRRLVLDLGDGSGKLYHKEMSLLRCYWLSFWLILWPLPVHFNSK